MPNQPKYCPAHVHKEKLGIELGKMPFYGQPRNCAGHIISENGIKVDKAKIDLISKLLSPTNVNNVRQFLGYAGFYRRFITDFSKIAKPLYKLLEKCVKFMWDADFQKSFEELKAYLTTARLVRALN